MFAYDLAETYILNNIATVWEPFKSTNWAIHDVGVFQFTFETRGRSSVTLP